MEKEEKNWTGKPFVPYAETLKRIADKNHINVETLRFPIRDMSVPTEAFMVEILDKIDESIEAGKPVYVHCWGGIGRTGTVVGCYLARHGIATGMGAINKIKELRKFELTYLQLSPATQEQRMMVMNWRVGR